VRGGGCAARGLGGLPGFGGWALPVAHVQLVGRDQGHDLAVPEVVVLAVGAEPAELLVVEVFGGHLAGVFVGDVRVQVEGAGVVGGDLELGGQVVLEERGVHLPEHEAAGDLRLGARVELLRRVAHRGALGALALIGEHPPPVPGAEGIDLLGARAHGVLHGQAHA